MVDKRAIDRGQLAFHDISFVEATLRYDRKCEFSLSIELTDFSIYYTQGAAGAVIALTVAPHTYDRPSRYTVAVKVMDIFGNVTMTRVPVSVG